MLVVGLGNPGSEYENTRHNIGFIVVDTIAHQYDIRFKKEDSDYLIGKKEINSKKTLLVKPLTYMNNSGWAVKKIVEKYHLSLNEILIIVDDFQLPLGRIRLRLKGSDGGHNGLYSIIYNLESENFARLRCGIMNEDNMPPKYMMSDFVLSPFDETEIVAVKKMIKRASEGTITVIKEGFQSALRFLSRDNF